MKYYHDLYVSKRIGTKVTEVIAKLEKDEVQFNKYLITITKNEKNHLEFFDSILFLQKIFEDDDLFVVGIAEGYKDAIRLVKEITEEVYEATKSTNIRKYLLEKQMEYEQEQ